MTHLLSFLGKGNHKKNSAPVDVCAAVQDCASVCLPKIQKIYPDFDLAYYTLQAEETIVSVLQAITKQDGALLLHGHERLQKQIDNIIANQRLGGRHTPFEAVILQQTALAACRQEDRHFNITFQCALSCRSCTMEGDAVIQGDREQAQARVYSLVLDSDYWLFTHFERG